MSLSMTDLRIINADVMDGLAEIEDESVQCVVTSPPYWGLRDYGVEGQIGLEPSPDEFVEKMVEVFREVRRVLRGDGVLWMNLGDSYVQSGSIGGQSNTHHDGGVWRKGDGDGFRNSSKYQCQHSPKTAVSGLKPKDLVGQPWRVALALQADGWYLRSDIIWHKPNPMPESVTDRPTKSHEYVFLMTKSARYFYDAEAVREAAEYGRREWSSADGNMASAGGGRGKATVSGGDPSAGRNARTVWTIPTQSYPEAHFATFPEALPERCIRAGSAPGDTVLDPFGGSGTTARVARALGRSAIVIELNLEYCQLIEKRCALPWECTTESNADQASLFTTEPGPKEEP